MFHDNDNVAAVSRALKGLNTEIREKGISLESYRHVLRLINYSKQNAEKYLLAEVRKCHDETYPDRMWPTDSAAVTATVSLYQLTGDELNFYEKLSDLYDGRIHIEELMHCAEVLFNVEQQSQDSQNSPV